MPIVQDTIDAPSTDEGGDGGVSWSRRLSINYVTTT